MKVIFLDIDGVMTSLGPAGKTNSYILDDVLIPYGWDKTCCQMLHNLIEQEDAEIVLSSDWRKYYSLEQMQAIFTYNGIAGKRLIGFTSFDKAYDPNNSGVTRSLEIQEWVHRHRLNKWVAVDDVNLVALPTSRFVHVTNPTLALADERVLPSIIKLLNQ